MNYNKVVIPYWRTNFSNGESDAIVAAIQGEHVSQGPIVAEFERSLAAYLKVPYVVATSSGSTALLMSCIAAGVVPGDEVIVPNRTWVATAHAPFLLGAKVRLVDVEIDRPILNADLIERVINEKTRAIMPVHMCGRASDMENINRIARRYNLKVIEDAAQALGSKNSIGFLGTQSDMGCFSLSVAKIISTGQGGFIATSSDSIYRKLIAIRTQGVGDIINATWDQPGLNFRFTDILAAIGIVQLKLLTERIEKIKLIYKIYEEELNDLSYIKIIKVDVNAGEIPIYIEILCESRLELIEFLLNEGIQCRPFYPDLNYAKYLMNDDNFPNSRPFGMNGVYLPSGPGQSIENIYTVVKAVKKYGDICKSLR
jgi:perosamine synthetase